MRGCIHRILKLLGNDGPMTSVQISDRLGVAVDTVGFALRMHEDRNGSGDRSITVRRIGKAKGSRTNPRIIWSVGLPATVIVPKVNSTQIMAREESNVRGRRVAQANAALDAHRAKLSPVVGNPFAALIAQVSS